MLIWILQKGKLFIHVFRYIYLCIFVLVTAQSLTETLMYLNTIPWHQNAYRTLHSCLTTWEFVSLSLFHLALINMIHIFWGVLISFFFSAMYFITVLMNSCRSLFILAYTLGNVWYKSPDAIFLERNKKKWGAVYCKVAIV